MKTIKLVYLIIMGFYFPLLQSTQPPLLEPKADSKKTQIIQRQKTKKQTQRRRRRTNKLRDKDLKAERLYKQQSTNSSSTLDNQCIAFYDSQLIIGLTHADLLQKIKCKEEEEYTRWENDYEIQCWNETLAWAKEIEDRTKQETLDRASQEKEKYWEEEYTRWENDYKKNRLQYLAQDWAEEIEKWELKQEDDWWAQQALKPKVKNEEQERDELEQEAAWWEKAAEEQAKRADQLEWDRLRKLEAEEKLARVWEKVEEKVEEQEEEQEEKQARKAIIHDPSDHKITGFKTRRKYRPNPNR